MIVKVIFHNYIFSVIPHKSFCVLLCGGFVITHFSATKDSLFFTIDQCKLMIYRLCIEYLCFGFLPVNLSYWDIKILYHSKKRSYAYMVFNWYALFRFYRGYNAKTNEKYS